MENQRVEVLVRALIQEIARQSPDARYVGRDTMRLFAGVTPTTSVIDLNVRELVEAVLPLIGEN